MLEKIEFHYSLEMDAWDDRWLGVDGWVAFVAVLMVLGGFLKLVLPNKCPHCNAMQCGGEMSAPKKKR